MRKARWTGPLRASIYVCVHSGSYMDRIHKFYLIICTLSVDIQNMENLSVLEGVVRQRSHRERRGTSA